MTSTITYVEARAAFSRRLRIRHLSAAQHRRIVADFELDWPRYWLVPVTDALIRDAAHLADTHPLRAYDAVHLAAARLTGGRGDEPVTFATWDTELETAARREGLKLLPRRG